MPESDLAASHELIEGDGLIIRPCTHEDIEDYYALTRSSKAISPMPYPVMSSRDAAWLHLAPLLSRKSHRKVYIAMDHSGRLIGVIYLTIDGPNRRSVINWLFKPILDQTAKALRLFLTALRSDWSRRLEIMVEPGRLEAAHLVIDLGFQKEANLKGYVFENGGYHDVWLFCRLSTTG
jgi:RimJ/RimL family protein N-acetyltransferase